MCQAAGWPILEAKSEGDGQGLGVMTGGFFCVDCWRNSESKLCREQQVIVSSGGAIDGFFGWFLADLTPQDGNKHGGTTVLDEGLF